MPDDEAFTPDKSAVESPDFRDARSGSVPGNAAAENGTGGDASQPVDRDAELPVPHVPEARDFPEQDPDSYDKEVARQVGDYEAGLDDDKQP